MLTEIADDMGAAATEGGFDRDDVHLSRTPLTLDQQGWAELNELLKVLGEQALGIQAQSAGRLQAVGAEESEAAALVLMLFEPPSTQGKTDGRKAKRQSGSKKKKG